MGSYHKKSSNVNLIKKTLQEQFVVDCSIFGVCSCIHTLHDMCLTKDTLVKNNKSRYIKL